MTYNAACPVCFKRYRRPGDTRGFIDVVRCSACPPARMLGGLALANADSPSGSPAALDKSRARYRRRRKR